MRPLRKQEEITSSWTNIDDKPLVSICCITYNHEHFIEDTLEGFLIQETDFPFEILIHDDASSDKTAEIIRDYEKKYPKLIKPIYQSINQYSQGKRVNAEFNLVRAEGEYIALCEGDDYWVSKNKLQRQVEVMRQHSTCSICFHPAETLEYQNGYVTSKQLDYGYYGKTEQLVDSEEIIVKGGPAMALCSILCRKLVFDGLLRVNPEFLFNSMTHFYLQISCLMYGNAIYLPDLKSAYRYKHSGSWSQRFTSNDEFRFTQLDTFLSSLMNLSTTFPDKHGKAISLVADIKMRRALKIKKISIPRKIKFFLEYRTVSNIKMLQCLKYVLLSQLSLMKSIRPVFRRGNH